MTELLQTDQKDYLQTEISKISHETHGGFYDFRWLKPFVKPALGGVCVAGVMLGVPGVNTLSEQWSTPQQIETNPKPQPTNIVAGVPVLVLSHRSEKECQSVGISTGELLKCAGMPGGLQIEVSQCTEDIKNVRRGRYSHSFGYNINEVPEGCDAAWVGVSADQYARIKDGQVYTFPGKPKDHIRDMVD
jgi:hypothetical protein